jgi:hypothetical protein
MTEYRGSFGKDRKVAGRKLPGKDWLGMEAMRVTNAERQNDWGRMMRGDE